MSDFSCNLHRIRKKSGLTQSDFARKIGLSASYVSQIERGERTPSMAVSKLLEVIENEIDLAAEIEDAAANTPEAQMEQKITSIHMIPVIGWAHAGDPMNYEENPWEQHIPTECRDPDAFAVVLEGDSMEPRFEERDMLIVQPSEEAYSGSLAIAKFSDGGVIFRRIEFELDAVRLIPTNVRYQITTHSRSDFEWIYPIWGRWTQIWK